MCLFNIDCLFTFCYFLCKGNDAKHNVFSAIDCWWLWEELVEWGGGSKKRCFSFADVESYVLSLSCMPLFFTDHQLHRCFMIGLHMCLCRTASSHWCHRRLSCTRIPALISKFGSQPGLGIISFQFITNFWPEPCLPYWTHYLQILSDVSIANKVSKSELTRKVECAHHFWKCADPVCQKLSKLVRACRNYSLPKLARFLRHNVDVLFSSGIYDNKK